MEEDIEYAVSVFSAHERLFRERDISVKGCNYLEIGPGKQFGPQLLMADREDLVTVADRFLSSWDVDYHPTFYSGLLSRVCRLRTIERVIDQSRYDGVIALVSAPAEDLREIPEATFDIVVSNAVLEHLYDVAAAAREMRRVSKAGAIHSHQVDFRDHRDFTRPLEYLLLSRRKFMRLATRVNFEFGCQTRPLELVRAFEKSGYSVDDTVISDSVNEKYLDEFMPRLRRSWFSSYRRWDRGDLRVIGARYWMRA